MTPALLRENGHRRMNAKTNHYALWAWCLQVLGNANENAPQSDYVPGIVDRNVHARSRPMQYHRRRPS